jgi:hypothetical protein
VSKLLLIGCVAFLSACDSPTNRGTDGYTFDKATISKQQVTINIIEYDSLIELNEAALKVGAKVEVNGEIMAFSVLRPPSYSTCTIHIVNPKSGYRPEYIGHEMIHCFYGEWHKKAPRPTKN